VLPAAAVSRVIEERKSGTEKMLANASIGAKSTEKALADARAKKRGLLSFPAADSRAGEGTEFFCFKALI
jgi:hypothetical protein